MQIPRFRLSCLLGFVAVIGAGLVALQTMSRGWGAVTLLGSIAILLTAVLGSMYRTGDARAFSIGMALFGWFYMFLAFAPWSNSWRYLIDYPPKALRAAVWTTYVPDGGDQARLNDMDTEYDRQAKQTLGWPAWHTYGPVAHSLAALLFGIAGGTLAQNVRTRPTDVTGESLGKRVD